MDGGMNLYQLRNLWCLLGALKYCARNECGLETMDSSCIYDFNQLSVWLHNTRRLGFLKSSHFNMYLAIYRISKEIRGKVQHQKTQVSEKWMEYCYDIRVFRGWIVILNIRHAWLSLTRKEAGSYLFQGEFAMNIKRKFNDPGREAVSYKGRGVLHVDWKVVWMTKTHEIILSVNSYFTKWKLLRTWF